MREEGAMGGKVGGGGSNVGYGFSDEWPTVVSNGFTGVITKDEGVLY